MANLRKQLEAAKQTKAGAAPPLKANTVDNNRAADYEQDDGGELTVFRGYTANRCRLSN